jgi:hypothetical protein
MYYNAYNEIVWEIYATDEYLEWFSQLSEYDKEIILAKVHLLVEFGPELSRPHADTLHGSKVINLKELRAKTSKHISRKEKMKNYFIKN